MPRDTRLNIMVNTKDNPSKIKNTVLVQKNPAYENISLKRSRKGPFTKAQGRHRSIDPTPSRLHVYAEYAALLWLESVESPL